MPALDIVLQVQWAIAENMRRAMVAGQGKPILRSLPADLVHYARYHFSHKERLIGRIGYPGLAEHRQQHQDLRAKVRAMHQRSASGEKTMTIEVVQFVVQYTASDIPRSCCIWILAKPTFTRFTYARM